VINFSDEINKAAHNFYEVWVTKDAEKMEIKWWIFVIYVYLSKIPEQDKINIVSELAKYFKLFACEYYKDRIRGWGYEGTFLHALEQTLPNPCVDDEEILKIFNVIASESPEASSHWINFLKIHNEQRAKFIEGKLFVNVKKSFQALN